MIESENISDLNVYVDVVALMLFENAGRDIDGIWEVFEV
jgi:hypothetical protein